MIPQIDHPHGKDRPSELSLKEVSLAVINFLFLQVNHKYALFDDNLSFISLTIDDNKKYRSNIILTTFSITFSH